MKSKLLLIFVITIFIGFVFTERVGAAENTEQQHKSASFSFFSLVEPLGVTALSCLLITFITGLFRRKIGRRFLKVHRIFAWMTITFALCHGVLVLVL